MITIIRYSEQYKIPVQQLIIDIQQNEFNIPITIEDQPDLHNVSDFYQKNAGEFWVATSKLDAIGTIACIDIGDGQCALRKMFVRKDYRQDGIAQRLLDTLENHCASQGIDEIFLGTRPEFKAAHKFYEKNSYKTLSQQALPQSFPLMKVDSIFYHKIIKPL
jgi:N-acetylglutamate synthase-like GNAT family acetyltransferase